VRQHFVVDMIALHADNSWTGVLTDHMTQITAQYMDELRATIGAESPPETRPLVTQEQIARYCYAVDDVNPLYLDEHVGATGPYGHIAAPPLFSGAPSFPPTALSQLRSDGLPSSDADPLRPPLPGARTRLTGSEFVFLKPIRVGDVLTRRSHLADVYAKEGRSGAMVFTVRETRTTDQIGHSISIERVTTAAINSSGGAEEIRTFDADIRPGIQAESIGPPPSLEATRDFAEPGTALPSITRYITPVQVFLYGAIKRNSHLIHYDKEHAQKEGLPERVAQGDLLADFLSQVASRWASPIGALRTFAYEARGPGFVGETVVHSGTIVKRWSDDDADLVEVILRSTGSGGRLCLQGSAVIAFPKGFTGVVQP
jgi:hydroxyacyl-ACP dehydratase HTD2-like protein with hotdog domain